MREAGRRLAVRNEIEHVDHAIEIAADAVAIKQAAPVHEFSHAGPAIPEAIVHTRELLEAAREVREAVGLGLEEDAGA